MAVVPRATCCKRRRWSLSQSYGCEHVTRNVTPAAKEGPSARQSKTRPDPPEGLPQRRAPGPVEGECAASSTEPPGDGVAVPRSRSGRMHTIQPSLHLRTQGGPYSPDLPNRKTCPGNVPVAGPTSRPETCPTEEPARETNQKGSNTTLATITNVLPGQDLQPIPKSMVFRGGREAETSGNQCLPRPLSPKNLLPRGPVSPEWPYKVTSYRFPCALDMSRILTSREPAPSRRAAGASTQRVHRPHRGGDRPEKTPRIPPARTNPIM